MALEEGAIAPATTATAATTTTAVRLHVTGFGPFNGVSENPTTLLIEDLRSAATAASSAAQIYGRLVAAEVSVVDLETLETSASAVQQHCDKKSHGWTGADMAVHFGVAASSTAVAIERQSFNDASFRVPDEQGYRPWRTGIVGEKDIGEVVESRFPIDGLVALLRQRGWDESVLITSEDPGRFVCNYVYCLSLCRCPERALFVHVPTHAVLPREALLSFAIDLFEAIGLLLGPTAADAQGPTVGSVR